MDTLYKKHIIDHYKNPRNSGRIEGADYHVSVQNSSCGDEIELFLKLDDAGKVERVRFESRGCAISVATMSMLSEQLVGLTIEEAKAIEKREVLQLTGLEESSGRVKCGSLAWDALQEITP